MAPVLVIPEVLALLGDNPMQSEFAFHVGLRGKLFRRACWVEGHHTLDPQGSDQPLANNTADDSDTPSVAGWALRFPDVDDCVCHHPGVAAGRRCAERTGVVNRSRPGPGGRTSACAPVRSGRFGGISRCRGPWPERRWEPLRSARAGGQRRLVDEGAVRGWGAACSGRRSERATSSWSGRFVPSAAPELRRGRAHRAPTLRANWSVNSKST